MAEASHVVLQELTEKMEVLAARLMALCDEQGETLEASVTPAKIAQLAPPQAGEGDAHLLPLARPALPDPRLVRRILRQRRMRNKVFDPQLFGEPAWDMLLDLTAARAEHRRVSVSSLCLASGVPTTTALRWINEMVAAGWMVREKDDMDRRRAFVSLSDRAARAMACYFKETSAMWQECAA